MRSGKWGKQVPQSLRGAVTNHNGNKEEFLEEQWPYAVYDTTVGRCSQFKRSFVTTSVPMKYIREV